MAIGKKTEDVLIFNTQGIFMIETKRPLSPHLQIYKPQLTSLLSISHRLTGVFLTFISISLPVLLLSIILGEHTYEIFKSIFSHALAKIFLIILIFTLSYHLTNGIRHLLWDCGIGLSLKESYLSGYLVIISTIIITILSITYM